MTQGNNSNILGVRLQSLKDHYCSTWGELADIIGISRSMLDFVKRGTRDPGPKILSKILEAEQNAGIAPKTPPSNPETAQCNPEPFACRYPEVCDLPRELALIREQQANTYREVGELKSLLESLLEGDTLERIIKEQRQSRRDRDTG